MPDRTDSHGRVVNKGNRNSIDYWNNRADNLQNLHRGDSWEISNLSDEDLELGYRAYDPAQQQRRGFTEYPYPGISTYTPGEVIQDQSNFAKRMRELGYVGFPSEDVIREYNYRKAIRDAGDNEAKKKQINNDYVRNEWQDYHKSVRDEIENEGKSWPDWLQATYGTRIDPATTFRIHSATEGNIHIAPQDNTNVAQVSKLRKIAEKGERVRNL